jgi:hypothetical protein
MSGVDHGPTVGEPAASHVPRETREIAWPSAGLVPIAAREQAPQKRSDVRFPVSLKKPGISHAREIISLHFG